MRTTYLITRMGRTFETGVDEHARPAHYPTRWTMWLTCMVVADGMGGMAAGEKASQLAIKTGR